MENDKNYFQVGLFVLVMILAGVSFSLWLTASSNGNYNKYVIHFAESVSGLKKESEVKFRGVDVGKVEKININLSDPKLIQVDIAVLDSTPVKTDTTATLKLHGITGEVYIELSGSSGNAHALTSKDHKTPEIKSKPSDISTIVNGVPRLLDKANHVAEQLGKIFSDDNVQAISSVAKKLQKRFGGK